MTPVPVKAHVLYYASIPWPKEIILQPSAEFPWLTRNGKSVSMKFENAEATYKWVSDEGHFGSIFTYTSGTYEASDV